MNKKNSKHLIATSFSLIAATLLALPSITLAYSIPSLTPWSYSIDVGAFLGKIADLLFLWAAPLCVLMIIVGGVIYMTAGDDEKKTSMGKSFVKFALIGLAIILAAGMLMNFVSTIGA